MNLKNEVIVGIALLAGVIVAVIGALWLSGKPWGEEQLDVVGVFREVGELREGNPVKFRGVQVGRVSDIALSPTGEGVLVTMEVPPDLDVPEDVAVILAPASLFGDWQAQIVGRQNYPDLEFTFAAAEDVLPGATLPDITQLTAVGARIATDLETLANRVEVAFTEETAIKLRETVENVQEISEQLSGFVEQQTQVYAGVSGNVLQATQNIEQATRQVEQTATRLSAAIDEGELEAIVTNVRLATENLQEFTAELDTLTNQVPGLLGQVEATLAATTTLVEQLEPAAAELGPTLAEARQAAAGLNQVALQLQQGEGTLGRLIQDPAVYEELQRSIVTLQRVLADLQANPGRYIGEVRVFDE